jgi:hypothetical protein
MRALYVCVFLCAIVCSFAHGQSGPVITVQPQGQTVLDGQPATLSVSATGAASYQWYINASVISQATGASYTFTPSAAQTGSIIFATVRGSGTQVQSANAIISVIPRTDQATITDVENFGSAPAPQVVNGFGLNVTSYHAWEFEACASIHCSWVRFDCPWNQQEVQSMPSNTSAGFVLSKNCTAGMESSASYGLHPSLTAYWGAPYSTIAVGTTSAETPPGSTTIVLGSISSGSLQGAIPGQTTVTFGPSRKMPTNVGMYEGGSLLLGITGNTLNLAMHTNVDIPANTTITVSLLLYPPVMIPPQPDSTSYLSNSSLQAFDNYLHFMATQIVSTGNSGTIEIWNEPENPNDCWDWAPNCYDTPPSTFSMGNQGGLPLVFSAMSIAPVAGVKYANGWTDTSGSHSLYNPLLLQYFTTPATDANQAFAWESLHPYGRLPEEANWIPKCLKADSFPGGPNVSFECTPIGGNVASNFKVAASWNLYPEASGGIRQGITESGVCRNCFATTPTETDITRFDMRQFIAYQGNGVTPVIFFRAGDDAPFTWFQDDHTPYPVATAFKSFLEDVATIGGAPIQSYTDDTLPQVSSYTGYYPLAIANIVGSRPGDTSNSVMVLTWQKSYTVPPAGSDGDFGQAPPLFTLASPPPVPVSLAIPNGLAVTSVKDLVEGTPIPYTVASQILTYPVADNPIEVILVPDNSQAQQTITFSPIAAAIFGNLPITLQATSTSTLPVSYGVSGPASISGTQLTITGAGSITVTAMQSGNAANAAAAPVEQTFAVAAAQPVIAWNPTKASIGYGTPLATAQLNATATVNGQPIHGVFAYSPATGAVLNAGAQQLSVTFTPNDCINYSVVASSIQIAIAAATPQLTWPTPAAIASGTALGVDQLNAVASVPGTLTFNPAAGTVLPPGTSELSATFIPTDQVNYVNASAQVSLVVNAPSIPVPVISNLSPQSTLAGGPSFTITINGSGFESNSTAYWGASALSTTFVSSTQLSTQVPAASITTAGQSALSVTTPGPAGSTSNAYTFDIESQPPPTQVGLIFLATAATATPGTAVTYQIVSPSSTSRDTVTCLNLPTSATCSYNAQTNVVTVTTTTAAQKGTYQITVVLNEAASTIGAAGLMLPFLLFPQFLKRIRRKPAKRTIIPLALAVLFLSTLFSGCCSSLPANSFSAHVTGTVQLTIQ